MIAHRTDVQYLLRLPEDLRKRIKARASLNGRSINTEIVAAIEKHLNGGDRVEELEKRVAALESSNNTLQIRTTRLI
jgi:predicted DNA-binding protein